MEDLRAFVAAAAGVQGALQARMGWAFVAAAEVCLVAGVGGMGYLAA